MSDPDYVAEPRRIVCEHVNSQLFNYAVLLLADSHTGQMTSWYHFSGHPETWTPEDIRKMAWQIADYGADSLKREQAGQRLINTAPRKPILLQGQRQPDPAICLGFALPWRRHRLWFWIALPRDEALLGFKWYKEVTPAGQPWWGFNIHLGIIKFRFTSDYDERQSTSNPD